MDDITSAIKAGKDSGATLKPRSTVNGIHFKTNENEKPTLPTKGGVDQGIARPIDDSYKGLKEVLGADKDAKMIGMKKGGMVSKCPYDGIAERGKTRAKLK